MRYTAVTVITAMRKNTTASLWCSIRRWLRGTLTLHAAGGSQTVQPGPSRTIKSTALWAASWSQLKC